MRLIIARAVAAGRVADATRLQGRRLHLSRIVERPACCYAESAQRDTQCVSQCVDGRTPARGAHPARVAQGSLARSRPVTPALSGSGPRYDGLEVTPRQTPRAQAPTR